MTDHRTRPLHRSSTARRRRLVAVAAVVGAATVLAACGSTGSEGAGSGGARGAGGDVRTVTATATGTAIGVPDQLTASIGVSNQGPSAADVLAENNTRTTALIDAIEGAGIDAKDVATTSVNLGPNYGDDGEIDGYQASNSLRITLRDLETAGAKLDALVRTVGDSARVDGISLGFQDDDALLSKARADAVGRAKVQAEEMAAAAGAELGEVRAIADVVGSPSYPYNEQFAAADTAGGSSMPIEAGSQELTLQVRVAYELR